MTIFNKVIATAIIISTAGLSTSAFAQDNETAIISAKPANNWLLTLVTPINKTGFQTLRSDISPQAQHVTPWTDRSPLVLGETPAEKYVKTDLSDFSYPVLGAIEYGVKPDHSTAAAASHGYQDASIVSSSFGSNPFDRNTFTSVKTTAAQIGFKF